MAPETVLNYVKACCSAHLFSKVERQDVQGKALLAINEKYYVVDQGLRQAVYGGNGRDVSQVLENIVCMEALRRGCRVTVGKLGEREVDFVLEKTGETIYVQVAYLIATEDTARREFEPLQAIRDNYPKYVVSLDEVDLSRGGIMHRNIRQFLLASAW